MGNHSSKNLGHCQLFKDNGNNFKEIIQPLYLNDRPFSYKNYLANTCEQKRNSFIEKLKELDDTIRINPADVRSKEVESMVDDYVKGLLDKVKDIDPRWNLSIIKSGSYYESLRVGRPYEFDLMLEVKTFPKVIKLVSHETESAQYEVYTKHSFSSQDGEHSLTLQDEDETTYMVKPIFKTELYNDLVQAMKEMENCNLPIKFIGSPKHETKSLCLFLENEGDGIQVDLVPCIKYPADFTKLLPKLAPEFIDFFSPLNLDVTSYVYNMLYLVPNHDKSFADFGWRLSTSQVEQEIMRDVQDMYKAPYRLCKYLSQMHMMRNPLFSPPYHSCSVYGCSAYMPSYIIKLIFMNFIVRKSKDKHQHSTNIGMDYIMHVILDAIFQIVHCLEIGSKPNYGSYMKILIKSPIFAKGVNLQFRFNKTADPVHEMLEQLYKSLWQIYDSGDISKFGLLNFPPLPTVSCFPPFKLDTWSEFILNTLGFTRTEEGEIIKIGAVKVETKHSLVSYPKILQADNEAQQTLMAKNMEKAKTVVEIKLPCIRKQDIPMQEDMSVQTLQYYKIKNDVKNQPIELHENNIPNLMTTVQVSPISMVPQQKHASNPSSQENNRIEKQMGINVQADCQTVYLNTDCIGSKLEIKNVEPKMDFNMKCMLTCKRVQVHLDPVSQASYLRQKMERKTITGEGDSKDHNIMIDWKSYDEDTFAADNENQPANRSIENITLQTRTSICKQNYRDSTHIVKIILHQAKHTICCNNMSTNIKHYEVYIPTSVEHMDLRRNDLDEVPACSSLQNVTELKLGSNLITAISTPKLFPPHLIKLSLRDNKLTESFDLQDCLNLQELDLSKNPIRTFNSYHLPKSLVRILVGSDEGFAPPTIANNLNTADIGLLELPNLIHCTKLKHVDLSKNAFRVINTEFIPVGTETLNLSSNKFSSICLSSILNLTYLDISVNCFLSPLEADSLPVSLTHFIACQSTFYKFPNLTHLINLKVINFEMNDMYQINSKNIPIKVEKLNLGRNKINTIPDLQYHTHLQHLDFSSNRINRVPLQHLPNQLVFLNLKKNRLSKVPSFCKFEHLTELNL